MQGLRKDEQDEVQRTVRHKELAPHRCKHRTADYIPPGFGTTTAPRPARPRNHRKKEQNNVDNPTRNNHGHGQKQNAKLQPSTVPRAQAPWDVRDPYANDGYSGGDFSGCALPTNHGATDYYNQNLPLPTNLRSQPPGANRGTNVHDGYGGAAYDGRGNTQGYARGAFRGDGGYRTGNAYENPTKKRRLDERPQGNNEAEKVRFLRAQLEAKDETIAQQIANHMNHTDGLRGTIRSKDAIIAILNQQIEELQPRRKQPPPRTRAPRPAAEQPRAARAPTEPPRSLKPAAEPPRLVLPPSHYSSLRTVVWCCIYLVIE